MRAKKENPAVGIFGKHSRLYEKSRQKCGSLPDANEFEDAYINYLKQMARQTKTSSGVIA